MDQRTLDYYSKNAGELTQRYESASSQLANRFRSCFSPGGRVLDVGCGSGNAYFKDDMKALGVDYNGCDLYNQEKETNLSAIRKCMNGGADIVTLNNVLNTIEEKED